MTEIDPGTGTMSSPVVMDVQATIDTKGPLALAQAGSMVILSVDTAAWLAPPSVRSSAERGPR